MGNALNTLCGPQDESASTPFQDEEPASGPAGAAAPPVPGKVVEAPPGKLGVVFGTDPATGYATITLVRETSPLKGKVEVNDIVIAIDGEDTSTHTNEEIVKRKFCLRCTRVSGSSRPRCETRVESHPGYAPRYRTPTYNLDSLAAVPHPPVPRVDLVDKEASTRSLTLSSKV